MKKYISIIIIIAFLASCGKAKNYSTIDKDLQQKAEKVLRAEAASSHVDSAIMLVMEVKTGEIKVMVKITKTESATYSSTYTEASMNLPREPGSIFQPFSVMAAMENSQISLEDSVETENGIYAVDSGIFKDNNSNKGGYGKITVRQSLLFPSNIGVLKTVLNSFDNLNKFEAQLDKMSVLHSNDIVTSDSVKAHTISQMGMMSIGYNFKMTPLQLLSSYNAIANNGRMMKAIFKTGQDSIINPHICSDKTIQAIQQTLCEKADMMLKDNNQVNTYKIAGIRGTSQYNLPPKIFDFKYCCSYFPSNKPEYTCLVIFYLERNYVEELNIRNSILTVVNQIAGSLKSN